MGLNKFHGPDHSLVTFLWMTKRYNKVITNACNGEKQYGKTINSF